MLVLVAFYQMPLYLCSSSFNLIDACFGGRFVRHHYTVSGFGADLRPSRLTLVSTYSLVLLPGFKAMQPTANFLQCRNRGGSAGACAHVFRMRLPKQKIMPDRQCLYRPAKKLTGLPRCVCARTAAFHRIPVNLHRILIEFAKTPSTHNRHL